MFCIILFCIVFPGESFGQLPPSTFRISAQDSAVDLFPLPGSSSAGVTGASNYAQVFVPSRDSSFGTAFVCAGKPIMLKASEALNRRNLTVSLWARIDSADQFNILCAYEPKSSPRHWELFIERGTGKLSIYIPGNNPDHLRGANSIADGKWHHVTMKIQNNQLELLIDGQTVGVCEYNRPFSEPADDAKVAIGSLAERGFGAPFAVIDQLRITEGSELILGCEFDSLVEKHSDGTTDPSVLSVISQPSLLNTSENATAFPTFDELKKAYNQETKIPAVGSMAELNGNVLTILSSEAALDELFPTGFPDDLPDPTGQPAKNVPLREFTTDSMQAVIDELGLRSVNTNIRPGVIRHWGEQYVDLERQIARQSPLPRGAADQVADRNSLILPNEKSPVEVVVRRIGVLLESGYFETKNSETKNTETLLREQLDAFRRDYELLREYISRQKSQSKAIDPNVFPVAAALRRNLMFANPLLSQVDRIAFLARASYSGSRLTNMHNSDRIGGHFATQVYGFNTMRGGGLFTVDKWRETNPVIVNLTEGRTVANGRLAGKPLDTGSFYTPDLGFDGQTLYFSYCESQKHRWYWSPQTTWNLFKLTIDGKKDSSATDSSSTNSSATDSSSIEMLTDSPWNDFDVCELPSGRLAFVSERRGGFIRCFGEGARLQVTTAVLHSSKADGSDIYPISFFETSEWQPSVDNNGMLVYTRWDYTDRENCLGSNFWICAPDGRNPRAPHGNYPFPWHTFSDNTHGDHRFGRCPDAPSALPMTEMQIRAIPNSHKYVFTAAPHHGETFGSLCLLDLRVPNDNHMSQVRRITPYTPFPESESAGRSQYRYGAPWPLDERTFLCNSWEDLVVIDVFGNEELICERELLPINYDPRLRLSEPMPVRPRTKPPVIPQQTTQGEDYRDLPQEASIGVVNVRVTDQPLPEDRPIKYLRVLQVIPKPNPWMNKPMIGYYVETTPRIPLGIVPVEPDGSAYFSAPAGKQLLFQILDERYQAVQTMKAVAFVHPGENLVCTGCHEQTTESVRQHLSQPSAFRRAPSKLQPELGGEVEPINFYRLIQPILDQSCQPCHVERKVSQPGMQRLGYDTLRPYVYSFAGGMFGSTVQKDVGGSRAIPGRFGSSASRLTAILNDENHHQHVTDFERHKFILWMDANAPRLGAFQNEESQVRGELVWPILDTDMKGTP